MPLCTGTCGWARLLAFFALTVQDLYLLPCAALKPPRSAEKMVSLSRPGSQAARNLFRTGSLREWVTALSKYEDTVKAVGKSRKKEKELVKWDKWMRAGLSEALHSRGCLSKEEITIVMNWKITRGTFRPLMNQLLSNTEKQIADATKLAVERLRKSGSAEQKIRSAVEALCQLRGIGPATATAVLCMQDPHIFPFMSDEAIEGAGLERKYTLDCYCQLAELLSAKAEELGGDWTAELVGRAMWAEGLSGVHGVSEPKTKGSQAAAAPADGIVQDDAGKPEKRKRSEEAANTSKRKKVSAAASRK